MAGLRTAEIRFRGRHAGALREAPGGGSVFEYADDATADIGCALPRSERVHAWPAGVHPFFQHPLRPEWEDGHWRVLYRASVEDAFARLEG